MARRIPKPEPVHTTTVCSVCGLDFKRHGAEPTIEKCVELLKADLAAEKRRPRPLGYFGQISGSVPCATNSATWTSVSI